MTTITLVQVPYLDLLNVRDIYHKTAVWLDSDNKYSDALKIEGCPYKICKNEQELLACVESSITTTLIVSDQTGYELVA